MDGHERMHKDTHGVMHVRMGWTLPLNPAGASPACRMNTLAFGWHAEQVGRVGVVTANARRSDIAGREAGLAARAGKVPGQL